MTMTSQQLTHLNQLANIAVNNPENARARANYYAIAHSYGSQYAGLAKEVPLSTSPSGLMAQSFMLRFVENYNIGKPETERIVFGSAQESIIGLRLMQLDYTYRISNFGQDANLSVIREMHRDAFALVGLPIQAWTAHVPTSMGGLTADTLWNLMLSNPGLGPLVSLGVVSSLANIGPYAGMSPQQVEEFNRWVGTVNSMVGFFSRDSFTQAALVALDICKVTDNHFLALANSAARGCALIRGSMGFQPIPLKDPIFVDLGGNGLKLVSETASSAYLATGTNFQTHTGWTQADTDDAILVRDLNADGQVSFDEIVGLVSGNALSDLHSLDSDTNQVLDVTDIGFTQLRLWLDRDGDAQFDAGEMLTMVDAGIVSIGLTTSTISQTAPDVDAGGNQVLFSLSVSMADNTTRKAYDVLLVQSSWDTTYVGPLNSELIYQGIMDNDLNLAGSGSVANLLIASTSDSILKSAASALRGSELEDPIIILMRASELTNSLLLRWAGVNTLSPTARGEFADAGKLAALEKFTGISFLVGSNANPSTAAAGSILDQAWATFIRGNMALGLAAGKVGEALGVWRDSVADNVRLNLSSVQTLGEQGALMDSLSKLMALSLALPATSSLSDHARLWAGGLAVLDEATVSLSNFSATAWEASVATALTVAGLGGMVEALRNPIILPSTENFYYHRAEVDGLILTGENGSVMSINEGDRIVIGGAGNDILRVGEGKNLVDLGGGRNQITYDLIDGLGAAQVGININMATGMTVKHSGAIDHFSNVQEIVGSRGNDIITGSANADYIVGISNVWGVEEIHAGAGNDAVYGYDVVNPWLGHGNLHAWGEAGDDLLVGTQLDNRLYGGIGNDVLYALGGNDVLSSGEGTDLLDGGEGTDTADFSWTTEDLNVSMTSPNFSTVLTTGTVTLVSMENVWGGSGNDTLVAGGMTIELRGGAGDDFLDGRNSYHALQIRGGTGNDVLMGAGLDDLFVMTSGSDSIDGGAGLDTVSFQESAVGIAVNVAEVTADGVTSRVLSIGGTTDNNTLVSVEVLRGSEHADLLLVDAGFQRVEGRGGNDLIVGGDMADVLLGGLGADKLDGGNGNDTLNGEEGNDTLYASLGIDVLAGGEGIDTVDFSRFMSGVTANMGSNFYSGASGSGTLSSFEHLVGSDYADTLSVTQSTLSVSAGNGNDTVFLYDQLNPWHIIIAPVVADLGDGDDWAAGNEGDNVIMGGNGSDTVYGNGGADFLIGGQGNDVLDGGWGYDTVSYRFHTTGVTVDLAPTVASANGLGGTTTKPGGEQDVLVSVERVIGSEFDDVMRTSSLGGQLFGGAGNDALSGREAGDLLVGGAGNDVLVGHDGNDILVGGAGEDRFVINGMRDWNDIIDDFTAGEDKLMVMYIERGLQNEMLGSALFEVELSASRAPLGVPTTLHVGTLLTSLPLPGENWVLAT